MPPEEAHGKRADLWIEMQGEIPPERAEQIVQEAWDLLEYFDSEHPLHNTVQDIIRLVNKQPTTTGSGEAK